MKQKVEIITGENGERFLKIGSQCFPISGYKEINGKQVPVIKCRGEEIRHPDGRQDVIIYAPCLSAESSALKPQIGG